MLTLPVRNSLDRQFFIMSKSVFNLNNQETDVVSKIVVGLERISEAFRVLLWQHAKVLGLSPIQIQILIFADNHPENLCGVSYLAKEFNVSKPTVSEAVRTLVKKEMVERISETEDKRAYFISLTNKGKAIVASTEGFANPIHQSLDNLEEDQQIQLLQHLTQLIYRLNRAGILTVQRTCFACRFYEKKGEKHYCHYLNERLLDKDLRLDCPEFEGKAKK